MSRLCLIFVVAFGLGCGNRQKADTSTDASAPESSAEQAALPRLERVPPPGQETGQVRSEPSPSATPSPLAMPKPPPGLKGILVPPGAPGASNVALEGCLSLAERTEEASSRFPAQAATRGPAKSSLNVSMLGGGALVVHEIEHGCCLKADVTSKLEGRTVTVTETLSGKTCRCQCRSTVRAAVSVPPGEYTLKVVTDDNGQRSNAYEAPLSVR